MRHLLLLTVGLLWLGFAAQAWPHGSYVNESFEGNNKLLEAAELLTQDRDDEAVAMLLEWARGEGDMLMPVGDHVLVSATERIHQHIRGNPRLLAAYRQRYRVVAEGDWAKATLPDAPADAIDEVWANYPLTRAGLAAGLVVAGRHLERAEPWPALRVLHALGNHPDAGSATAERLMLEAVAAALLHDAKRVASRITDIRAMDGQAADRVDEITASLMAAPVGGAPAAPAAIAQAKPWAPMQVRTAYEPSTGLSFPASEKVSGTRAGHSMLPATDGRTVYLNATCAVLAVNPADGSARWRFEPTVDAQGKPKRLPVYRTYGRGFGEMRGVAMDHERVYAVVAQGTGVRKPAASRAQAHLVALDKTTGQAKWDVTAAQVGGAKTARGKFIGTPALLDGRLYALLNQDKGVKAEDTFLVCVDAATGKTLWWRHALGVYVAPRAGRPPASNLLVHGRTVYVSDGVAAAASFDAQTGRVHWAKVFTAGQQEVKDAPRPKGKQFGAGDTSPPAMIAAGLVVPAGKPGEHANLLDPFTGRTIERFTHARFKRAQFVSHNGDLIVAGSGLARYDGRTLDTRWETPLGEGNRLMGRLHVAGSQLLAPTRAGLLTVGLDDGQVARQWPNYNGGNSIKLGESIILAHKHQLRLVAPSVEARPNTP